MKKIIHIDMDAFFASVEQRDYPEYQGRPLIVGGDPAKRGVVAACSYEARQFGIHSAMPSSRAQRLCPQAIFVRPRIEVYREVSEQIRTIFRHVTEKIEPLSLDEAYLDVTDVEMCQGSATLIAKDIKKNIKQQTGLIASAGVSYNKFLAKIASDMDKPDGLYLITPAQGEAFVAELPVGKFYGVGKATEAKMKRLKIERGGDLKQWPEDKLIEHFGKVGKHYFQIARGIDKREVINFRKRKSLGTEQTYEQDLSDNSVILQHLEELSMKVARSLSEKNLTAKTLIIKIKYDNFELITRSKTMDNPFENVEQMILQIPELLSKTEIHLRKVRLLGVTVSNLIETQQKTASEIQTDLFST